MFFFFKCHISRDYRPVLWAGSSLVFIIKWPSNRSSGSGSSPSSEWRSRLWASVPSRELLQSLWCIFQRGCDATARVPHSSVSSITSSELLLSSVDNPLRFVQPGWLNPESVYANLPPLSTSLRWPVTNLFIWIILNTGLFNLRTRFHRMKEHLYMQIPQLTSSCTRTRLLAPPHVLIPVWCLF